MWHCSDQRRFPVRGRGESTLVRWLVAAAVLALAGIHPGIASAESAAQARIVGGTRTSTAEAPWVVALTTASGQHFCGGTLVRPDKVVTAAHCTLDPSTGEQRPPAELQVVSGRTDLRTDQGVVTEVARVWRHPEYTGFTQGEDVAVLTLSAPAPQSPLRMVGAAETGPYRQGTPGRVFGWGRTSESGPLSHVLRSVEVPVIANADCAGAYSAFDAAAMFCAGAPEGGQDACAGDSGGPFVVNGRLVGIVSFGTGCARAGQPGVYTRLSAYADEVVAHL